MVLSEYASQYMAILSNTEADLEHFFIGIDNDLRLLSQVPQIQDLDERKITSFLEADPKTFRYAYTLEEREVIRILASYRETHGEINSVYLGLENGAFTRSHERSSPTRYDPRQRPWYIAARENLGRVVRTEAYSSITTSDVNIGTVLALTDTEGRLRGVIGIDVTLGTLSRRLGSITLPLGGYVELWDHRGTVLVSPLSDRIGVSGEVPSFKPYGRDTLSRTVAYNPDWYRVTRTLGDSAGRLVAYIPSNEVSRMVWTILFDRVFSVTLFLLFAFVFILAVLRRNVLTPLHLMTEALGDSAQQGVPARIQVSASGEFMLFQSRYNQLVDLVDHERNELKKTKFLIITSLASLAQKRDNETGLHLLRTQKYMESLADAWNRLYSDTFLDPAHVSLMVQCAPLHDIGKVAIPDRILLKPGKLDQEEQEEMKRHTTYGKEAIEKAQVDIDDRLFFSTALAIVYNHHERWDGNGYPERLLREEIPIEARFMAIADVYDALTSKRVYKEAYSHDQAVSIIKEGRGTQFDPRVVEAFLSVERDFHEISLLYSDPEDDHPEHELS
jgi:HD-GYP domain-containing protein (c-di-GMP phosphodiesterase class II)